MFFRSGWSPSPFWNSKELRDRKPLFLCPMDISELREATGSLSLPAQPNRERLTLGVNSCIQKETELMAGTECSLYETLGESLPSWGFIWVPRQEPPEILPVNSLHFTQTFSREDYCWDVLCAVAWNYYNNGRGVHFHDSLASSIYWVTTACLALC